MSDQDKISVIPDEVVMSKIYLIRSKKIMLDMDLAELYGVETKRLNEQVKRNVDRFPHDFMFQLNKKEFENLRSQFATSSWGGRRNLPFAFTEHGVLMLSSVINSERAIKVNIKIMRIYTKMYHFLQTNKEILQKIEALERKEIEQDQKIIMIFEYLRRLEKAKGGKINFTNRKKIGFKR
jgi:hypothetical protein